VNRLLMAFSPEFSGLFRLGSVFSLGVSRHLDAPAVGSTAGVSRHPSLEADPIAFLQKNQHLYIPVSIKESSVMCCHSLQPS